MTRARAHTIKTQSKLKNTAQQEQHENNTTQKHKQEQ